MKLALVAALACLALALTPDTSFAAKRMKAVAGGKCETGRVCAASCNPNGVCQRFVCVGNKWERRLPNCQEPFCGGPRC